MYKNFIKNISSSEYIQLLVSKNVDDLFADPQKVISLVTEIEEDLAKFEKEHGFMPKIEDGEESVEYLKQVAQDTLIKLVGRVISESFEAFLEQHEENCVDFSMTVKEGKELDLFFYNITQVKPTDKSLSAQEQQQVDSILSQLKQAISSGLELKDIFFSKTQNSDLANDKEQDVEQNNKAILLENAQAVCFKINKDSRMQKIQSIVLRDDILTLLTQYELMKNSHNASGSNHPEFTSQMYFSYLKNIIKQNIKKNCVCSEMKLSQLLGFLEQDLVDIRVQGKSVNASELSEVLFERQFKPQETVKKFFKF